MKYTYLYVLQGYYGYGWEDLTAVNKSSPTALSKIKADRKTYLVNAPGTPYRIIQRRELNTVPDKR